MLESLGGGKTRIYVPNSGPGSQYLEYGTLDLGYFGEVSSAVLLKGSELQEQLETTVGVLFNENISWLKFAYRNEILYVAKQPISHSVSWEELYQKGLVYGTEDAGPKPSPNTSPVNQTRYAWKDTHFFKIRLLSGTVSETELTVGGEWNELLYRVHASNPLGGEAWDNFTDADLHVGGNRNPGGMTLVQERDTNARWRGYSALTSIGSKAVTDYASHNGWRPALVLIRGIVPLLKPMSGQYVTSGDAIEPLYHFSNEGSTIKPIVSYEYDSSTPIAFGEVQSTPAFMAVDVVPYGSGEEPVAVAGLDFVIYEEVVV